MKNTKTLLGRDIKGIRFLHVPKCAGSYTAQVLKNFCDHANLDFINEGHEYHLQVNDGAGYDDDYLYITSVRNPLDLLVSVFFHAVGEKHGGFAHCAVPFLEQDLGFVEFFYYFCLYSDFGWVSPVWPFTKEAPHFLIKDMTEDIIDDTEKTAKRVESSVWSGKDGRVTGRQIYTNVFYTRPHPWTSVSPDKQMWELLRALGMRSHTFPDFSFSDCNYPPPKPEFRNILTQAHDMYNRNVSLKYTKDILYWSRYFYDGIPTRTNYKPVFCAVKLWEDQRLVESELLEMFKGNEWDEDDLVEYWHFSTMMWNSLFDLEKQTLIPDIILRVENLAKGLGELGKLMEVKNYEEILEDCLSHKNVSQFRDTELNYLSYYDDQMLQLADQILVPEMKIFGYNTGGMQDDFPLIIVDKKVKYNFTPPRDTLLYYKWALNSPSSARNI